MMAGQEKNQNRLRVRLARCNAELDDRLSIAREACRFDPAGMLIRPGGEFPGKERKQSP